MRIALFNQETTPGFFTHSIRALQKALLNRGDQVLYINVAGSLDPRFYSQLITFNPELTLSHYPLLPFRDTKQTLSEVIEVPHLTMLLDPILPYIPLMHAPLNFFCCPDIQEVFQAKEAGYKETFFLPHAIDSFVLDLPPEEKIYPLSYIAFFSDYEAIRKRWHERESKEVANALDSACEQVLSDSGVNLASALLSSLMKKCLHFGGEDVRRWIIDINQYTRGKDRIDLVRSIKEVSVHVFGGKYRETEVYTDPGAYLSSQKNVILHPKVSFQDALSIINQSKICLNSTPFFKQGSHERIFLSLALGAIPISSENDYLRKVFSVGKELYLYPFSNHAAVNEWIAEILSDDVRRKEMAERGKRKVALGHTWTTRVEELVANLPSILYRP